jgi:hypothetical protein
MKKKILSVLIACCLCFGVFTISTAAYEIPSPQGINSVQWAHIRKIVLAISYSNGTVSWSSSIVCNSEVESIDATYTLYKLNSSGYFDYIASWTGHSDSPVLTNNGSVSGSSGTYKLVAEIIVTTDTGDTEEVTTQIIKAV